MSVGYSDDKKVMAEIIVEQARLFLVSMIYGILLGVWYEVFRTVRKEIVHGEKMVHLEDVIFCFSAAAGLFLLFQIYNQGRIRFYVLTGIFVGNTGYFLLLSDMAGKILRGGLRLILYVGRGIGDFFIRPVKIIVNSLIKRLKKTVRTVKIMKSRK